MVRTPNPWWLPYIVRNLREGVLVANAEHISWVTPTMALEIGRRANLHLTEYWLIRSPTRSRIRKLVYRLMPQTELLVPNYLYVFRRPSPG